MQLLIYCTALLSIILFAYSYSWEVYLLFLSSTLITFIVMVKYVKRPFDFVDPIVIFMILSLIAYQIKYYICDVNPSLLFFFNDSNVNFQYEKADYLTTIIYQFIGWIGFIAGYLMISSKIRFFNYNNVVRKIKKPNLSNILIVNILFSVIAFIVQYKYKIGLLLEESPILTMKLTGIIFYFFIFGSGFLFLLYINSAVRSNERLHIVASFTMLFISTFLSVMSFSKAGFLSTFIILLIMAVLLKEDGKIPAYIKLSAIAALLLFLALFPVIQLYRFSGLESGIERGFKMFPLLIKVITDNFSYDLISTGFIAVFQRIPGFDVLLPIVAYGKNEHLLSMADFIKYLMGSETSDYANFFKIEIMGVSPMNPTGFEITLLGFLYIYFGAVGIAVGMFLWGILNKILFGIIKRFYFSNPLFGFPILSIYITSFIGVTFGFGGNTIFMTSKTFIATVFLLIFWMKYFGKNGQYVYRLNFSSGKGISN